MSLMQQLKRKRGPEEVLDFLQSEKNKAAKGVMKRKERMEALRKSKPVISIERQGRWDMDFDGLKGLKSNKDEMEGKELVRVEEGLEVESEGEEDNDDNESDSDDAVDFEDLVLGSQETKEVVDPETAEEKRDPAKRAPEKPAIVTRNLMLKRQRAVLKKLKAKNQESWKLSEPIGGRMINVDPVFADGEKYLIVANRTTMQVYSTADSLLTRSIKLQIDFKTRPDARIVTYCVSSTEGNILWVACSDGAIYRVDWTTGNGTDQYWGISSTGCIHMTAASMESAARRRDIVFTTESRKDGGWRITANELAPPEGPVKTDARTIYTSIQRINFLKTADEGRIIVAASENKVLIGKLRSTDFSTVDKIRYEFLSFESTDLISALDVRVYERQVGEEVKSSKLKKTPVVDVVVGDVKGVLFVHNDLLANLMRSQSGNLPAGISLIPRKLHWHRQAVQTAKWSPDGNYIISGGSETVLVLWQLDTGKQQFLPHMSATIQNVTISPSGSSYGIQLADNSAMVLSTAELKPTANIAGIQACVVEQEEKVESRVHKVEDARPLGTLIQRTPAVINPIDPTKLLLGVGQMQEIQPVRPALTSVPYLQTFDLGSGRNVSRQALTRTNITNINISPNALPISEPRVTHMKVSHDGKWLATVDEWMPPARDLEFLAHQAAEAEAERRQRLEVYLKFWLWNKETDTWELASRIDAPHSIGGTACKILDLAADHASSRFATIGEDNTVRVWSARTRKRDNVVVRGNDGKAFQNWNCQEAISLGKPTLPNEVSQGHLTLSETGSLAFSEDGSVLAAACGHEDHSLLHLLDPELGIIKVSKNGLFEGNILKLDFLWKYLITVSNTILVHDLVLDETTSSINLTPDFITLTAQAKHEMVHLAVDRKSKTFAVAVPAKRAAAGVKSLKPSLLLRFSELVVIDPAKGAALLREQFRNLVTALVPAVGSEGYIVLDTAAEIRTVLKKGSQAITALAQSTSALKLDAVQEEPAGHLLRLMEDTEAAEEVEEVQPPTPVAQDDNDEFPVVTQHQLSEIFDIGPAFALPPLEEMFYQVAGLFAAKPVAK